MAIAVAHDPFIGIGQRLAQRFQPDVADLVEFLIRAIQKAETLAHKIAFFESEHPRECIVTGADNAVFGQGYAHWGLVKGQSFKIVHVSPCSYGIGTVWRTEA